MIDTPFMERSPRLSPNGRWLAYVTNATGRDEVWVRAFPGPGGEWLVTTGGAAEPLWARDGEELFYRTATHLVAVEVETGSTFRMGRRTTLFRTDAYHGQPNHTTYDVMPDDETFALVKYDASREVIMVQNFLAEVRAKVGR